MKQRRRNRSGAEISLATVLEKELGDFRRDLRATLRAYSNRLETDLAQVTATVSAQNRPNDIDRENLHNLRELMILLRKRKLKPEKGRRKDVRKLDLLIRDIHSLIHPDAVRE
ncbi:MAG TPA: hypothetical protein VGM62_07685 [Chthoniobacterales bacterium]|jgi:hypothetical protein